MITDLPGPVKGVLNFGFSYFRKKYQKKKARQAYCSFVRTKFEKLGELPGENRPFYARDYIFLNITTKNRGNSDRELAGIRRRKSGKKCDCPGCCGSNFALHELLQPGKKYILTGGPGAGKSTFLRYCAWLASQPSQSKQLRHLSGMIPILIRFKDLKEYEGDISRYLKSIMADSPGIPQKHRDEHLLTEAVNSGKALILIDGLDEGDPIGGKLKNYLLEIGQATKNIVIISSRPSAIRKEVSGYQLLKIDELDYFLLEKFTRLYFPEKAEAIRFEVFTDPDLGFSLERSPFILKLMADQFIESNEIRPGSRTELIGKAVRLMLRFEENELPRWSENEILTFFIQVCKGIASDYFFTGQHRFSFARVCEIAKKVQPDPNSLVDVTELLLTKSNMFESPEEGKFEFRQWQFLEYFCALYAAEQAAPEVFLKDYFFDEDYLEVIPMVAGLLSTRDHENGTRSAVQLLECILAQEPPFRSYLFQPELLAGVCLSECRLIEGIPEIENEIEKTIRFAAQNWVETDQLEVVAKIMNRCSKYSFVPRCRSFLSDLLEHSMDLRIRLTSCKLLSVLGMHDDIALKAVTQAFMDDPQHPVREVAQEFLLESHRLKYLEPKRLFEHVLRQDGHSEGYENVTLISNHSEVSIAEMLEVAKSPDVSFEARIDIVTGLPPWALNRVEIRKMVLELCKIDRDLAASFVNELLRSKVKVTFKELITFSYLLIAAGGQFDIITYFRFYEFMGIPFGFYRPNRYFRKEKNLASIVRSYKGLNYYPKILTNRIYTWVLEGELSEKELKNALGILFSKDPGSGQSKDLIVKCLWEWNDYGLAAMASNLLLEKLESPENRLLLLQNLAGRLDAPNVAYLGLSKLIEEEGYRDSHMEEFKLIFFSIDLKLRPGCLRLLKIVDGPSPEIRAFAEDVFEKSDTWEVKSMALSVMGAHTEEDRMMEHGKHLARLIDIENNKPRDLMTDYRILYDHNAPADIWSFSNLPDDDPVSELTNELLETAEMMVMIQNEKAYHNPSLTG